MRISEYIAALEKLKAEHGDLQVATYDGYGNLHYSKPAPEVVDNYDAGDFQAGTDVVVTGLNYEGEPITSESQPKQAHPTEE